MKDVEDEAEEMFWLNGESLKQHKIYLLPHILRKKITRFVEPWVRFQDAEG